MKEIITDGGFVIQVDDEDYDVLSSYKWHAHKGRNTWYAIHSEKTKKKEFHIQMHRLLLSPPSTLLVDHIDKNGLNNQKSNLRICSNKQNQANRLPWGKSNYLGVSYERNKYIVAHIRINGKPKHLGRFKTEKEAAIAYNDAAIKYHGEFASLNKI